MEATNSALDTVVPQVLVDKYMSKAAAERPSECPLICRCLSQTEPIAEYNPST